MYTEQETVSCRITITNTGPQAAIVGWASAQMHCQCIQNTRLRLPPAQSLAPTPETAFSPTRGERGRCVLQAPPVIFACDLVLSPSASTVCRLQVLLIHFMS